MIAAHQGAALLTQFLQQEKSTDLTRLAILLIIRNLIKEHVNKSFLGITDTLFAKLSFLLELTHWFYYKKTPDIA